MSPEIVGVRQPECSGDSAVHFSRPRGLSVLVHLGIETLQQRSSEGRSGLSRERERVLQNLCGLAFHRGDSTRPGAVPKAVSTPDGELLIRAVGEVPDTTPRGMWKIGRAHV